jgi:hypothetical protein
MKLMPLMRTLLLLMIAPVFMKTSCNDDLTPTPQVEFINWQMTGAGSGTIESPPGAISVSHAPGFTAFGGLAVAGPSAQINFVGSQLPGNYPITDFTLLIGSTYYVKTTSALTLTVTQYGVPGQYILGSYAGTVKDSASTQTFAITGNFKIKNEP